MFQEKEEKKKSRNKEGNNYFLTKDLILNNIRDKKLVNTHFHKNYLVNAH